ncbi:MAG: hypothetical protein H6865_06690 [Rhodospirillales bacterium]|nr:hypothetical protein [Alphaproteobacteria bacterium]MCB9987307.1 hypothetical protein [Rhodospirillales bacterium]USO07837.1 MAG: hypothetical protein H6866_01010 [Rhodospirillales bacterium]
MTAIRTPLRIAFAAALIAPVLTGCSRYDEATYPRSSQSIQQGASLPSGGGIGAVPLVRRTFDPGSGTYSDKPEGQVLLIGPRPREVQVCYTNIPVMGPVTFDPVTGRALSPKQIGNRQVRTQCPGGGWYNTP